MNLVKKKIEKIIKREINYDDEKEFWKTAKDKNLTYEPIEYLNCNIGYFENKESNPPNILNILSL